MPFTIKATALYLLLCAQKVVSAQNTSSVPHFTVEYEWNFINFTWKNPQHYADALNTQTYIPENNFMVGVKNYADKFYIALPRVRKGAPVTLAYFSEKNDTNVKRNVLLNPFPDWESQNLNDCNHLQNVQSMEIDENGTMWVLDGTRFGIQNKCPPKIVLYNLNIPNSEKVQSFDFPNDICLHQGGFLNDLVIDGDFAYITDTSGTDPGLIVFSRKSNETWKVRHDSMKSTSNFTVDGIPTQNVPIDGIALSNKNESDQRFVYFCALNGRNLYSIPTSILQNRNLTKNVDNFVKLVGVKESESDGLTIDNEGNLYFGLLTTFGVAKWNIHKPFSEVEVLDSNRDSINWPDCFAFDGKGNLYLLANQANKFFNIENKIEIGDKPKFRLLKFVTNTKSYLY